MYYRANFNTKNFKAKSNEAKGPDDSSENAYNNMIRMLTRREYSCFEIKTKLKGKFTPQAIQQALDKCIEQGYQSEERFAEMLVRHMDFAGYGYLKLRLEARRKGADLNLIEEYASQVDWDNLAFVTLSKRYSIEDDLSSDFKERNKALAYLSRRGFSPSNCRAALERLLQEQREFKENNA